MSHLCPTHRHPGPLRRLFAALADRCTLRLTAADLPPRDPVEASHWEPEPAVDEPQVCLPRSAFAAKPARPARTGAEVAPR